jgi:hypothetical protein
LSGSSSAEVGRLGSILGISASVGSLHAAVEDIHSTAGAVGADRDRPYAKGFEVDGRKY